MSRFSLIRALLLALAMVAAGPARAVEWHMATPYAEGSFHTVNIRRFAGDVATATATGDEVTIVVHAAGSLFRHPQIKNAVRGGQVQLGELLLSRLANEDPLFEVDSVPFLATDYGQAGKLWAASRQAVSRLFAAQGLRLLFAVPWPPQGLFANRPITRPGDLRGVRFRAYNTATERLARLLGAVPTQVEVADIPQAFATGRVDAMITSPSTGANTMAWDYVDQFYNLRAWLPKNVVVVNERAFRRLPEAARRALLAAAAAAETRGWDMSRDETEAKLNVLRAAGMEISPPSSALAQGFNEIGEKMAREWAARAGADGAAILDAYRH